VDDPRVELSRLTNEGDGAVVVGALDSVRVVVSAVPERTQTREDQAALYNLVSAAARLFPHLELRLPSGVATDLAPFAKGDLRDELQALHHALASPATTEPTREFHLAWASDPGATGLAGDAAGWSYSVGPDHLELPRRDGPALGGLAATSFMVAQAFGHALAGQLPFHATAGFVANLLDYQNAPASEVELGAGRTLGQHALLGCGSVGSSVHYAALLAAIAGGPAALVDPDPFRDRNKLRYPVLREIVEAAKVTWLAELAHTGGIDATPHESDIKGFLAAYETPPVLPLTLVSVDTVEGRRDATDALALTTLTAGVAGMQLHVARHGFGEEGCAYCQYVNVAPTLSGAQALAERVGLSVERVIAIQECEGGYITQADAEQMASSGRFQGPPPQPGERLADLDRRIYAQARVETGQGDVLISTPFVSAMAGLLLLAEALKESDPRLHAYRLRGRYDLDMSGEPPGFTGATPRDPSGRCLCHSRFRRNAYRRLHGLESQHA
jgi:hypothetical protein